MLKKLFERFCPCLTHKMERDINSKAKNKRVEKAHTPTPVVTDENVANRQRCSECGKVIRGLQIHATNTSIKVLCARCTDAKPS